MINLGDISYRKHTTGRLFFQRAGQTALLDFGNVRMHKVASNIDRTKTTVARKGFLEIVSEQPNQIERRWTVGLDEETLDLVRLQLTADAGSEHTQAAITSAATMSVAAANKGQVILIGFDALTAPFGVQDVNSVTVADTEETPTTYVEGTDYTLDAKAGTITILPSGNIADATALHISYKAAQVKNWVLKSNTELTVSGVAIFDEYDQVEETPRTRITFPAQIISKNEGDNDGKKNSEFEVELLVTGQVQRATRQY